MNVYSSNLYSILISLYMHLTQEKNQRKRRRKKKANEILKKNWKNLHFYRVFFFLFLKCRFWHVQVFYWLIANDFTRFSKQRVTKGSSRATNLLCLDRSMRFVRSYVPIYFHSMIADEKFFTALHKIRDFFSSLYKQVNLSGCFLLLT